MEGDQHAAPTGKLDVRNNEAIVADESAWRNALLDGFQDLVSEVHSKSTLHASRDHGDHHWRLVACTGAVLLEESGAGDPMVLLLFGLFHDSQRVNEFDDPEHGKRGGILAHRLLADRAVPIDVLKWIDEACTLHTEAAPSNDVVLGTCWDADRLNLWRVGIEPHPRYLSTAAARDPARIAWARGFQREQPSWSEIVQWYRRLVS